MGYPEYRLSRWDDGVGLPWHSGFLVGWPVEDGGIVIVPRHPASRRLTFLGHRWRLGATWS